MIIEQIIITYLGNIEGLPDVYAMRPETKPDTYIIVEKTGSSAENRIHSANVAIQSYAPDLYSAAQLNEAVKEAMLDIVTLDEIASCRLQSDYNFTNTATKQPRYQAVFNITHY